MTGVGPLFGLEEEAEDDDVHTADAHGQSHAADQAEFRALGEEIAGEPSLDGDRKRVKRQGRQAAGGLAGWRAHAVRDPQLVVLPARVARLA